jgi:hypothetical protein
MNTRAQIIRVLEGEVDAIEERGGEDTAQIHHVLQLLIVGLEALEGGETPPLFVAKKVKAWGEWPAKVRKLRLIAIGAVQALRKVGYSAQEAIKIVADAHAVSSETVRYWRKTLGKDTELEAQLLIGSLPNSIFLKSKEDLLKAVRRTGEDFKKAQVKKSKKGKKAEAKKGN